MVRNVLSLLFVVLLAGCGESSSEDTNQRLIDAFQEGRTGFWITAESSVREVLGDETIGGKLHQKFSFQPAPNMTVQVRHSLADSQRVPVQPGDAVRVQGYYQWDARGGFISRTFLDPQQPGSGGWVEHDGSRYD
ncbi:MAG: DUF3465 domain-containing protein [Wenzhouxiangellaceae bacterium]|nr:DUF3465 domain-containing protein [Wenzhouxiangellaceae bacterium]